MYLKQSTSVVIQFGTFVAPSDGVTLQTGLATGLDNGSTGIKLSKNGGAQAVRHATVTTTTYDANGCYLVTLDTTDTNTVGSLRVIYTDAANCLPVWQDFHVVTANVYDSLIAGSTLLDTNASKLGGTSQTGRDVGASVLLSSGTGTGQVSLSSGKVALTTAEHTAITADVWDATMSSHTTSGTTGASLNAAGGTGDPWSTALPGSYASGTAGYIVGHNIDAQVSAVKAKTDNLPASPAAVGDIPTATQNADALLKRDLSAVTGEAAKSLLNVLRLSGVNKIVVSGSVLTAYKENDSTVAFTRTLGTDGTALPIISSTP